MFRIAFPVVNKRKMSERDSERSDENTTDSSDFKDFLGDDVRGYRFEPEYTEEELKIMKTTGNNQTTTTTDSASATSATAMVDRAQDVERSWCTCGPCPVMPTNVESICCHEVDRSLLVIDEFVSVEGNACIYSCV